MSELIDNLHEGRARGAVPLSVASRVWTGRPIHW
jgi:hypothetical protein